MSEERRQLEEAVVELEQVTQQLHDGVTDPGRAQELADRALELSARIGEWLPRVIRTIEDAAQGRVAPD